jgi:hypothetical protein
MAPKAYQDADDGAEADVVGRHESEEAIHGQAAQNTESYKI